jgi:hypothetical protein
MWNAASTRLQFDYRRWHLAALKNNPGAAVTHNCPVRDGREHQVQLPTAGGRHDIRGWHMATAIPDAAIAQAQRNFFSIPGSEDLQMDLSTMISL